MKIEIDWLDHLGNSPEILVSDAYYPGWPAMHKPVWEKRNGVHRADHGQFVHYFYTDGKPTNGFGGATFSGMLQDGTPFKYSGAWSSRASVVNMQWPDRRIVDVTLRGQHRAAAMLASELIAWWMAHETDWGLAWVTEPSGESQLCPTRNGLLKGWRPPNSVVEHLSK